MIESPLSDAYLSYQSNPSVETYNSFGTELLKYIKAIIKKDFGTRFDAVEDAIGESSIKILEQLKSFNPEKSPFPVWVRVIVRNTCTDLLRGNQVNNRKAEDVPLEEADKTYDFFTSHDSRITLQQITSKLSKPDQALVRAKLDGLTNEEIAHNYGVTQQAIALRWQTLIDKMRTLAGVDYPANAIN